MEIGNGFKVNSIVLYPEYAQVNGEHQREQGFGGNNSQTFNLTLDEARELVPGKVYAITLREKEVVEPTEAPAVAPTPAPEMVGARFPQ